MSTSGTVAAVHLGLHNGRVMLGRVGPNEFSVDDGLMTPTLKLKRRAITGAYAADIDALYTR